MVLLSMVLFTLAGQVEPQVSVSLLSGETVEGKLESLFDQALTLSIGQKQIVKPLTELLEIDFHRPVETTGAGALRLSAVDGSRLWCNAFLSDGKSVIIELSSSRRLSAPVSKMKSVLFAWKDEGEAAAFFQRGETRRVSDLLVIVRDGKQYELEGTIGAVREDGVDFLLDGETVPVKRDRIIGIHYSRSSEESASVAAHDSSGSFWVVEAVRFEKGQAVFKSTVFGELTQPSNTLVRIDFSKGRLDYLVELEPALYRHVPFFDVGWEMLRGRSPSGAPLRIGGVEYRRGIALHSKTEIEYSLEKKYRHFEAMVGIDDSAGPHGDASVRIVGDGKSVWQGRIRAGDAAQKVSLPVANMNQLRLEVDFGENLDIGDLVVFGDPKVIK